MIDWRERLYGLCDRARVERALGAFYRAVGFLPEPREIIWTRSPGEFGAMFERHQRKGQLAALLRRMGRFRRAERYPFPVFVEAMEAEVVQVPLVRGAGSLGGPDDDEEAKESEEETATLSMLDAVFSHYTSHQGGAKPGSARGSLDAILDECAAFFAGAGVAILCERPLWLGLDVSRQPHAMGGPFAVYPSGWKDFAFRGIRIDEGTAMRMRQGMGPRELMDLGDERIVRGLLRWPDLKYIAEDLGERIAEWQDRDDRRTLLREYGVEKFVADFGLPEQRDDFGTLYRVRLQDDEDLVAVKVLNSTPEPDGTFKDYWLRVPPETDTARHGVEWSFDVEEDSYYTPVLET